MTPHFDYRPKVVLLQHEYTPAKEADRQDMERIIRAAALDLDMETIPRGRPYTLRPTKNMASYHQRLSDWKEDVALLAQLS
ncbi:MAG: hypothetical protein R2795_11435 [Saprospiraceae bacterium]